MDIDKDIIWEGDRVNVYFEYTNCLFDVEVIYRPYDTGDSWILKDKRGNISYVQFFSRMDKLPRKESGWGE